MVHVNACLGWLVVLVAGYLRKKKVLEVGITLMDERLVHEDLPKMRVDVSSALLTSMLEHVEAALAQPEVEAPVWKFCFSQMSMNGIPLGDIGFGSITVPEVDDMNPNETFTLCFDDKHFLPFLLHQLANLAPLISFRLGMNQRTDLSIDMGILGSILIVRLDA